MQIGLQLNQEVIRCNQLVGSATERAKNVMNESGFFWRIPASKKQGRVRPTKPTIGP
jgi:hypothetical protein